MSDSKLLYMYMPLSLVALPRHFLGNIAPRVGVPAENAINLSAMILPKGKIRGCAPGKAEKALIPPGEIFVSLGRASGETSVVAPRNCTPPVRDLVCT